MVFEYLKMPPNGVFENLKMQPSAIRAAKIATEWYSNLLNCNLMIFEYLYSKGVLESFRNP